MNLPGLAASERLNTRTWLTETLTTVLDEFGNWLTDVLTAGYSFPTAQHVVVSYETAHAVRPSPLVEPVTYYAPQQRICSRRRRLGKGIYPEIP